MRTYATPSSVSISAEDSISPEVQRSSATAAYPERVNVELVSDPRDSENRRTIPIKTSITEYFPESKYHMTASDQEPKPSISKVPVLLAYLKHQYLIKALYNN